MKNIDFIALFFVVTNGSCFIISAIHYYPNYSNVIFGMIFNLLVALLLIPVIKKDKNTK